MGAFAASHGFRCELVSERAEDGLCVLYVPYTVAGRTGIAGYARLLVRGMADLREAMGY
jgi:hypothetical protein